MIELLNDGNLVGNFLNVLNLFVELGAKCFHSSLAGMWGSALDRKDARLLWESTWRRILRKDRRDI